MDGIYIIIFCAAVVIGGGFIASKLHTSRNEFRKCIGCQYWDVCDKGDPENKCRLDNNNESEV